MMRKFIRDRRGASSVEYLMLLGLVVILSFVAFRKFGYKARSKVNQADVATQQADEE